MTNDSCFNCKYKDYDKQIITGLQPVCGLPGTPRNWNHREMKYNDIADECNCYKKNFGGSVNNVEEEVTA